MREVAKILTHLVVPIIVRAKLLIQKLWLNQPESDDEVLEEAKIKWLAFDDHLNVVKGICIPRWFQYEEDVRLKEKET